MRDLRTPLEKLESHPAAKFMLRKPFPQNHELYYPAELAHLEKELKIYRIRKKVGVCNCCASKVEHQVYDPRKKMFFDHCIVCKHTDRF